MRILVIDRYAHRRDMAMMDMYKVISEVHQVIYADEHTILRYVTRGDYDILWLGIYHQGMKVKWDLIFRLNKRPVVIDQADNEEMALGMLDYSAITSKKLLSRYLPNAAVESYWKDKVWLLPWYVDPQRFHAAERKTYNYSFICSMNVVRIGLDRKKIAILLAPQCTGIIGECFDHLYVDALAHSRAVVIECGRLCLTQKYIEAALSECLIIGHIPLYPGNELMVIPFDFEDPAPRMDEIIGSYDEDITRFNKEYVIENFCNKNRFLEKVESILV